MSDIYYYEPLNQTMNAGQITAIIGSVVNDWSEDRKNEIGLFQAYFTDLPTYGPYTQKIAGSEWVKDTSGSNPRTGSAQPFYKQSWILVDLDGGELEENAQTAALIVANEIEARLVGMNIWASSRHVVDTEWSVPQAAKDYINSLLTLNTDNPAYPWDLADAVTLGTFTGWPDRLNALQIQQIVDPT